MGKAKQQPAAGTTFTDSAGDEWDLKLSVLAAADVQRDTGMSLVELVPHPDRPNQGDQLGALLKDLAGLCRVVWAVVRRQGEARGVGSFDDFCSRIGDLHTFARAGSAFLAAFVAFYMPPAQRAKALAVLARQDRLLDEQFDAAGSQVVAALEKALADEK